VATIPRIRRGAKACGRAEKPLVIKPGFVPLQLRRVALGPSSGVKRDRQEVSVSCEF
jgi:hypothetical protein